MITCHINLCDLILSRPGNPNRIISATLLIPGLGSAGISITSFEIGTGTSEGVIGGERAVDAETFPKRGKPGFTEMALSVSWLLFF